MVEFLDDEGFQVLNNKQPTYKPQHRPDYSAVLDLAVASEPLKQAAMDFKVVNELSSDHLPFLFTLPSASRRRHGTKTVALVNWFKLTQYAEEELA